MLNAHPYLTSLRTKAKAAQVVGESNTVMFVVQEPEWELLKELGIEEGGDHGLARTVEALAVAAQEGILLRRLRRRSLWLALRDRIEGWRRS